MKKTNQESNLKSMHVLVTDTEHDFLMKIFKDQCVGKVGFYTDEYNDNKIEGEYKASREVWQDFDWKWAHKIYYSYDRLTSMVGKYEHDGYFENTAQESMYIFNCLSNESIEIIKDTLKSHFLIFEIGNDEIKKIDALANITHNFYSAWERVMMKYHPFCESYDKYLEHAKVQLSYLKEHLVVLGNHGCIFSAIDRQIEDIEAFEDDDEVRSYLLEIYKRYVNVKSPQLVT